MSWDPSVFGGHLRCTVCGREQPLGDTTSHLRTGWPMCCSYTMRWLTQRELDTEQYDGQELAAPCSICGWPLCGHSALTDGGGC